MDLGLEILRHTLPGIYEVEIGVLITIYIVRMDIYLGDDIFYFYRDPCLFSRLTDGSFFGKFS